MNRETSKQNFNSGIKRSDLDNYAASKNKKMLKMVIHKYQLYLLLIPTLAYVIIFLYFPMYGILMAFKNYKPHLGVFGSQWVGFDNFRRLFVSSQFWSLISNTVGISVYQLFAAFPAPVILALSMNYSISNKLKKIVQTTTYAPHFISTVVLVGMVNVFFTTDTGMVNHIIRMLGFEPVSFLTKPAWFKSLYVWSGVWQNTGWSTIVYLSALTGIDPCIHESAIVDGATKIKRILHIDLPLILPTLVILLIMDFGRIMSVGFEKAYLLQNPLNLSSSEIISTYVYKVGLLGADYSFSTAVGLFNSVINFLLLISVNKIAKFLGQTSLF